MIYELYKDNTKWVESNDACTNLSEIQIVDNMCIVPEHIYLDSLEENEYLESKVIIKENKYFYDKTYLDFIYSARINSYNACKWYGQINKKIPTANSVILEYNDNSLFGLIDNNLKLYPFVKTCFLSPKDIAKNLIYTETKKAYNDILNSPRTNKNACKHLFMREHKNYIYELRCFWSRNKLRAVSLPSYYDITLEDKIYIENFFARYSKYIPYYSAVVDLGMTASGMELIEFNTFGPDMIATAGNFSWKEDWFTLLYSNNICYK